MLREGLVKDQSELARLAQVSQPRMTQMMNLTFLAPDIQERLLFLETVSRNEEAVQLRHLQQLTSEPHWAVQRDGFRALAFGLPK